MREAEEGYKQAEQAILTEFWPLLDELAAVCSQHIKVETRWCHPWFPAYMPVDGWHIKLSVAPPLSIWDRICWYFAPPPPDFAYIFVSYRPDEVFDLGVTIRAEAMAWFNELEPILERWAEKYPLLHVSTP